MNLQLTHRGMRVRGAGSLGSVTWSSEEVLAAVRARLANLTPHHAWTFDRAELEGDDVLVVFHGRDQGRFGVHYSLAEMPNGANTGCECETPDEWAVEIVLDMDEQIGTDRLTRAKRTARSDGLTLLEWVW